MFFQAGFSLLLMNVITTSLPNRKEDAASLGHSSQGLPFCPKPDLVKVLDSFGCNKADSILECGSGFFGSLVKLVFWAICVIAPSLHQACPSGKHEPNKLSQSPSDWTYKLIINLEKVVVTLDRRINPLSSEESIMQFQVIASYA